MADEVEERLESALKYLTNIAETGGYLKKEIKEDIQDAVSTIKNCVKVMKDEIDDKKNERKKLMSKVKEGQNEDMYRGDSRPAEQVAPSAGRTLEATYSNQRLPTSTAQPARSGQGKDDNHGYLNDNQGLAPSHGPTHRAYPSNELEDQITEKVNQMMENFTNKIKYMIKEEIIKIMQQDPELQRGPKTTASAPGAPTPPEERKTNMDAREVINNTEREEGYTKVQRRRRRERQISERTQAYTENESEHEQLYTENSEDYRDGAYNVDNYKITSRNRYKRRAIIGTKEYHTDTSTTKIQAGEKMTWRYVGKLEAKTKSRDLQSYLEEGGVNGEVLVEELNTKGRNKAFKIGVPLTETPKVDCSQFWPKGVIIRPFRVPWTRQEDGATLTRQ